MKEKALFCWSGGKDSAMALYHILQDTSYEVTALLTTVNYEYKRVSMHGIREELLEQQAAAIGLPLIKVYVKEGTNAEYEKNMETILLEQKQKGITKVIFGDIFLEDLRTYRENNLSKIGLTAVFPLWKRNTSALINYFFENKFKTIICCINDAFLNKEQAGVKITPTFIKNLSQNVDPCGENGEFHTFCYDGPVFKLPVKFSIGEKIHRTFELKQDTANTSQSVATSGFWYCDLLPAV